MIALRLLFFLTFVLLVAAGIPCYFWVRLIRDAAPPPPLRLAAVTLLALLAVNLPLSFLVDRFAPRWFARPLVWLACLWIGYFFYLLILLLAADLARLVGTMGGLAAGIDPARRLFLARLFAGGALATAGGLSTFALGRGLRQPVVRRLTVMLDRLPRSFDGMSIVQLTDLHVGPTLGRAFVEDVVRRTNALAPDLVVVTGDLADGSVAALGSAVAPLAELTTRHGVFFVTGNHEYYAGVDEWLAEVRRLGMRVLRNERVAVTNGRDTIDLAGVDDHSARHPGHGPDLARALAGRDAARALVLLAHQPRAIFQAARAGVDLQLSGHTHGGQIWPWNFAVRLDQPYVAGLWRHDRTQIYVSSGTGYWGPPMRLGTEAEITQIVLRSALP